jgi:hypothetical protein
MAVERAAAGAEATATLERHFSMACSMSWNRRVRTRGVLGDGGTVAVSVRTGRCMVPMAPLWSKKEVERVMVSPICSERLGRSQMTR